VGEVNSLVPLAGEEMEVLLVVLRDDGRDDVEVPLNTVFPDDADEDAVVVVEVGLVGVLVPTKGTAVFGWEALLTDEDDDDEEEVDVVEVLVDVIFFQLIALDGLLQVISCNLGVGK